MTSPISTFKKNMNEIIKLIDIHEEKTGKRKGRRYGVEVLNKSGVVLTTACWKAFVEDLASEAFDFLLRNTKFPSNLPRELLKCIAGRIRQDKDESKVWALAGSGWKTVLRKYKKEILYRFHTPKPNNVDDLFKKLLGLSGLSSSWKWPNMSVTSAKANLEKYVSMRCEIAHRLSASQSIKKHYVDNYAVFVTHLAIKSNNKSRSYLHSIIGKYPFPILYAGKFR